MRGTAEVYGDDGKIVVELLFGSGAVEDTARHRWQLAQGGTEFGIAQQRIGDDHLIQIDPDQNRAFASAPFGDCEFSRRNVDPSWRNFDDETTARLWWRLTVCSCFPANARQSNDFGCGKPVLVFLELAVLFRCWFVPLSALSLQLPWTAGVIIISDAGAGCAVSVREAGSLKLSFAWCRVRA